MASLLEGLHGVLTPQCLLCMLIGTMIGIIAGAIPGLSGTSAITLLIPITYGMRPLPALAMLGGIYNGGNYGGSIAACLFGVPGATAATVTVFDGFPLSQKGEANRALQLSVLASFIGGEISVIALLLFAERLAKLTLKFGCGEYFWVGILGISVVISLCEGSILKGVMSACLGFMFGMIGQDPLVGQERFTFGNLSLVGGLQDSAVLLGLFTIPAAIGILERGKQAKKESKDNSQKVKLFSEFFPHTKTYLISSLIGVVVGVIPAAGGNIGSFLAYDVAKKTSKHPETFGKGEYEGVIASEAANNGVTGGSFIPLLAMGIPGSPAAAAIMSAFMMQGLILGPQLFSTRGELVYGLIVSMFITNIFMLFLGFYGSRLVAKLLNLPGNIIAPLILCFSIIGVYSMRNNIFDVYTLGFFGLLGYAIKKFNFSATAFILAYILSKTVEENLLRLRFQQFSDNLLKGFFGSGLDWILIAITIISAAFPFMVSALAKKENMKY